MLKYTLVVVIPNDPHRVVGEDQSIESVRHSYWINLVANSRDKGLILLLYVPLYKDWLCTSWKQEGWVRDKFYTIYTMGMPMQGLDDKIVFFASKVRDMENLSSFVTYGQGLSIRSHG